MQGWQLPKTFDNKQRHSFERSELPFRFDSLLTGVRSVPLGILQAVEPDVPQHTAGKLDCTPTLAESRRCGGWDPCRLPWLLLHGKLRV
jgi:hypothetical protein